MKDNRNYAENAGLLCRNLTEINLVRALGLSREGPELREEFLGMDPGQRELMESALQETLEAHDEEINALGARLLTRAEPAGEGGPPRGGERGRMNEFLSNMRTIFEPGWMMRARQVQSVQAGQVRRISDLALELALEISPDIKPERRGDSPLEIAATDLANYLHGGWEYSWVADLAPPPLGWDVQYARTMLWTVMLGFDRNNAARPRGAAAEIRARRLAYDLAMAILDVSRRKDPEGLLDMLVHGEIDRISRLEAPETPRPR